MAAQLGRAEGLSAQPCGRAVERGHVKTLEHRLLLAEEVKQEQKDTQARWVAVSIASALVGGPVFRASTGSGVVAWRCEKSEGRCQADPPSVLALVGTRALRCRREWGRPRRRLGFGQCCRSRWLTTCRDRGPRCRYCGPRCNSDSRAAGAAGSGPMPKRPPETKRERHCNGGRQCCSLAAKRRVAPPKIGVDGLQPLTVELSTGSWVTRNASTMRQNALSSAWKPLSRHGHPFDNTRNEKPRGCGAFCCGWVGSNLPRADWH